MTAANNQPVRGTLVPNEGAALLFGAAPIHVPAARLTPAELQQMVDALSAGGLANGQLRQLRKDIRYCIDQGNSPQGNQREWFMQRYANVFTTASDLTDTHSRRNFAGLLQQLPR